MRDCLYRNTLRDSKYVTMEFRNARKSAGRALWKSPNIEFSLRHCMVKMQKEQWLSDISPLTTTRAMEVPQHRILATPLHGENAEGAVVK